MEVNSFKPVPNDTIVYPSAHPNYTTALDALSVLESNDSVFIQTAAAAPQELIKALVQKGENLSNISVYQMHTEGDAPYVHPKYKGIFNTHCFFVGANTREAVGNANADYIPVFLSEVPALFRKGIIPVDIALLHVSPPDKHGYCSLGVAVDVSLAVIEKAKARAEELKKLMAGKEHVDFEHFEAELERSLTRVKIADKWKNRKYRK